MRKLLSIATIVSILLTLSSCITTQSPTDDALSIEIGETQLFQVKVFFPGEKIAWFLDGTDLGVSEKEYTYEASATAGMAHTLTVQSTYMGVKDSRSWTIEIIDPGTSATIGPEGGELEVTDPESFIFGAKVNIPAGALAEETEVTIRATKMPAAMIHQPVGTCVNFIPDGINFLSPVDLIFPYNDEENDGFVNDHGVEEQKISVNYFNESSEAWEVLEVSERDTTNNRVSISTTHFSTYVANVATWQNLYGGSENEEVHACQQTADGGYIIAGTSASPDITGTVHNGSADMYIVKLDSAGMIEWQKMIGQENGDEAFSIQQTQDGGYIISGGRELSINRGGYYVAKLDSLGEIDWQKWYSSDGEACANMVKPIEDGGFIIAGTAYSEETGTTYHGGDGDYYIIRTDEDGRIKWREMYGGSGTEELRAIQPLSDGGFIVTGYSTSSDIPDISDEKDFHVFKLDSSGNVLWNKKYGGNGSDQAWFVIETSEKGYMIVGSTQSTDITDYHDKTDVLVVKTDSDGNILWQKAYGGSGYESASSVEETDDGGFIVAGISSSTDIPETENKGEYDAYIFKINASGDLEWQKLYGGSGREESDNCTDSAHQTADGGYMIVVDSTSTDIPGTINKGGRDFYVIKLDAQGNL